jgi:enoyl-CoA hydratase/carnithine racemase
MSDNQSLLYEVSDGIAVITINKPERGNAMTAQMARQVRELWTRVREDRDVRVAIITGAGDRHFCTGGDVSVMQTESEETALVNETFHEAVYWSSLQNRVWKPVIAAVNGTVNGGGLHFVVDADVVVASETAHFMDSHTNIGLVGAIENIGLMRRLPIGMALRMTLQGRNFRLPASRAYQLGLVDELVANPKDVLPAARAIAADMARNSPQAMALSKQALWQSQEMGYTQACENGWNLIKLQWSHPDFVEGPKAFSERREPVWNPDPNARNSGS